MNHVTLRTQAAIALVMTGQPICDVARATGVHRSLIHRRLKAAGLTAPKRGGIGRPLGSPNKKPRKGSKAAAKAAKDSPQVSE